MSRLAATAFLTLTLSRLASAGFGNAFSTGPTAQGNWIRVANSTLVVPAAPSPQKGLLSLWVGMGTSNGDLIQALTESYNDNIDEGCGVLDKNWCSWASALTSNGQQGGREILTNPGDLVTMSYMYNDATDMYDQYVLINGELISTFSTSSGRALGWGTAEECNDAYPAYPCGLVDAHDWIDTTLILDQAQPDYQDTFGASGAYGTLVTSDGGRTWTSDRISIDSFDYTPKCPDAAGTNLTTLDWSTFGLNCGADFLGGDLGSQATGSIQDCVTACDETTNCWFAVWNGTTCGLKSSVAEMVKKDGLISGTLLQKGC